MLWWHVASFRSKMLVFNLIGEYQHLHAECTRSLYGPQELRTLTKPIQSRNQDSMRRFASYHGNQAGKRRRRKARNARRSGHSLESLEQRELLASDVASSVCAAGTCVETESFAGVPDLSDAAVFDQFDPSLGTLLSVEVELEVSSQDGSISVDNDSNDPASLTVSFGAEGSISSSDVGLFSAIVPVPTPVVPSISTSESAALSLTGNDGDDTNQFDVGGTDWDQFDGNPVTDSASGLIDTSLFTGYEGTGTFEIDYDVKQVGSTTSAGGVFIQIDPVNASGSITVTYTYEPVVPPANPAIELDKFLWDINGSPILHSNIQPGDELIYSFNVTNSGDVDLTNVTVTDPLPGLTLQDQVAEPFIAHQQSTFVPTSGEFGPFASVDRGFHPLSADPFEAKAWDNFTFAQGAVVDGFSWTGSYAEPFATGVGAETPLTDFRIELFNDAGGVPGTLAHVFDLPGGAAGADDAAVMTTELDYTSPGGGKVYDYHALVPFTAVLAGDYWVSITALQTFPSTGIDPTWQWSLGTNPDGADGFLFYDDTFDDTGDNGVGAVNGVPTPANSDDKDLSFTIHAAELVDFDGVLAPGESVMFMGTYIVTEADVLAGEIVNEATANGHGPNGEPVSDSDEYVVEIDRPDPSIDLEKFLWDINGSPILTSNIHPGDELIYSFNVTNNGDVDLANVTLTDPLPGLILQDQVAVPYYAYEQLAFEPADGELGPFASVDRSFDPLSDDPFEAKAWDNFSLSEHTVVDGFAWTGAYAEPFATGTGAETALTDFRIELFHDNGGVPGAVAHTFDLPGGAAGVNDTVVVTTELPRTSPGGGKVYDYFSVVPFTLVDPGDYWISITALQTFPSTGIDPTWQWSLGTNPGGGDGFLFYDDTFDDAGDNGVGAVNGVPTPANTDDKDLAFTLHAARLLDFDGTLSPNESVMFMGTYIVTEADVLAGEIVNKATVTADGPFGTDAMDMDEYVVHIDTPTSDILLNKYLWDINDSPILTDNIMPGDELIYSFDVINTGDTTLTNVVLTDPLPGLVMDDQVALPYTAYAQPIFIPDSGQLGPFSSIDRGFDPLSDDPFEAKAWDNFSLSEHTVIEGIGFDGSYAEPFATGTGAGIPETDFLIEFYGDASGTPGTLLHSWTMPGGVAGVNDGTVTSRLLSHTSPAGGPVYHYESVLPFTLFDPGDYWVSITALQTFPSTGIDPTWQWHLGTNPGGGDGFLFYDDTFDDAGDGGVGAVNGVPTPANTDDKDLAFTLHAARLVDFDGTLEPGERVMFMGTYIVTEADVLAGEIVNKATVSAHGPFGETVSDMDEYVVDIAPLPASGIEIDKYLWDINGSPILHTDIHPGDELIYSFDVTNTGHTSLSNVTLSDSLPGVTLDDEVAVPYSAYAQGILIPDSGELGPFSSADSSFHPLSNDPFEAKAWDNFSLSEHTVIEGLSWDGAYAEPFANETGVVPQTDFLVEIFSDSSGLPGGEVLSFHLPGGAAGVSDASVVTTLLHHTSPGGGSAYHYEAMLPFTLLEAGDYWLSITALQTFPSTGIDPTWQWHLGTNPDGADGFLFYDDTFDDAGDNGVGAVNGVPAPLNSDPKDLSFDLHAARLVDFDGTLDPGETVMFMGTYYVTEADVAAGQVVNKATVTADGPFGAHVMAMDEHAVHISPIDHIDIDKFLWDINGSPNLTNNLMVGDELIYSFNVTNTGPGVLKDVTVTDPLPGLVMDEQVAETFVAYEQSATIPADGNLGPFASFDRSFHPTSDDPFEAKAWDNFTLSEGIVLDAVTFTGAYIEPFSTSTTTDPAETDFLIEFFNDDGGAPGTLAASFSAAGGVAGVSDENVTSTLLSHTAEDGGPVYQYHAMIPFTVLVAGDYWISITADQTFPSPDIDPTWQWHLGTNSGGADGFYSYDDTFDDAGDGGVGAANGTPSPVNFNAGKDLAFTLHAAELVDFDGTLDPGESVMFMGTYYVTQADIDAGGIVNTATASATTDRGSSVSDSDTFSYAIVQHIPVTECMPNIGDANGDDTVNVQDFLVLSRNFGQEVDSHTDGDFNCDGVVDVKDFLILSENFGTTIEAAAAPTADAVDSLFADGEDPLV